MATRSTDSACDVPAPNVKQRAQATARDRRLPDNGTDNIPRVLLDNGIDCRAETPTRCPPASRRNRAVARDGASTMPRPGDLHASGVSAPVRRHGGRHACTARRSANQLPNHWAQLPLAKALMLSGRAPRSPRRHFGGLDGSPTLSPTASWSIMLLIHIDPEAAGRRPPLG